MATGSGTGTPASGETRVTADEVREIFETTLINAEINAAIGIANDMISALDIAGAGVSETTLTAIELLLSAHFCALKDPRARREAISGEVSAQYQGKDGMGLSSTHYGQNALAIDWSGKLASAGKRRASLSVVFSAYDEFSVSASSA